MASPNHDLARDAALAAQLRRAMAARARTDPAAFCQFVLRDENTGARIRNAPMHAAWHRLAERHDRLILTAHVDSGKLLPLPTPVPTPNGWTMMGALEVGDEVFGRDGQPCVVSWVSPVETDLVAYRITFDDGVAVEACADHQWLAKTMDDGARETAARSGRLPRTRARVAPENMTRAPASRGSYERRAAVRREKLAFALVDGWRVVTTQQILDAGITRRSGAKRTDGAYYDQYRWRMPLPAPVEYGPRPLPVHPYVLGVWLGNGHTGVAQVTLHGDDAAIGDRCMTLEGRGRWLRDSEEVHRIKFSLGEESSAGPRDGRRFVQRLRALGVLDDKHVPEAYLTASVEQRRELLAGLLDTDGYVSEGRQDNHVEFCNTNERVARGALELARSLGFKATVAEGRATLDGVDVGPKWRVCFTAHEAVFWSPRKLSRQVLGGGDVGRTNYRSVVAVEPVPPSPMRCITVSSPDHTYLVGRDYLVTHNTAQLSIGRTLHRLGRDPNRRVVIVTKTAMLAQKILRSVSQYITRNDALHAVFPDLKRNPDPKLPWNVHQLTVDRDVVAKDPSVQATGIFGNIHGSRIDDLVLDDVLDSENTRTKTPREHLWNWIRSTLFGRLTNAATVLAVTNAWHPDDAMHRLAREPGFVSESYPVLNAQGEVTWPDHWPENRIEKARMDMGPFEFARALLCQARADDSARFKREWVDECCARGEGIPQMRTAEELYDYLLEKNPEWADEQLLAHGARLLGEESARGPLDLIAFYTGVDLAFSKASSADLTCIFTVAVFPNGDRWVLEVDSGRWDAPDTLNRIESAHERWGSIVMVESVGAQRGMLDILSGRSAIPVVPYQTGSSASTRLEFVIEAVAVEVMNHKWVIPSGKDGKRRSREVDLWIGDLFAYDASAHCPDRVAAMCFARECARRHEVNKMGNVGVRVIRAR